MAHVGTEIRIFTLNCWGIPLISKNRTERITAIGKTLASKEYGDFDLVCLQEVWSEEDYLRIKEHVKVNLSHSHYFYSGVLGSGLCIFSKFPFQDVFFHKWPVNGYVHKLQHGDWFGGKGVGLCRLRINGLKVNLYTAHLHAEYNRSNDEYLAHRVLQAFDTAQFIRLTSGDCDVIILAGDLNTEPEDLSYRIVCLNANLDDAFNHNPEISHSCTGTNESMRNSYSDPKLMNQNPQGKRIDYILFRGGQNVIVAHVNYSLVLPPRIPGQTFSYSDHEAVAATLGVNHIPNEECGTQSIVDHLHSLQEGIEVCDEALVKLHRDRRIYFQLSGWLFLFFIIILSTNAPYGMQKTYNVLLSIIFAMKCFTLFMGTLWNRIEVNGILSGREAMALAVSRLISGGDQQRENIGNGNL